MSDLFRRQVIQAQSNAWLGSISLVQPRRTWMLALLACAIGSALILFLVFGSYTQRLRVRGRLVPAQGLATVVAPASGVMESMAVTEGDVVREQQVLGLIRVPRLTADHGDTATALRATVRQRRASLVGNLAAQRARLKVDEASLRAQLLSLYDELALLQMERKTRRSQAQLASEVLERMRRLQTDKYVSDIQLKQQEAIALDRVSSFQEVERQASALQRSAEQIGQALAQVPIQRASTAATHRGDLAKLSQEEIDIESNGALEIAAPTSGVLSTQIIKPGQTVQAGQPLFTLLPKGSTLRVELLVPSRAIPTLRPGGTVLLRYEAFPYQKFGHYVGHVTHIGRSALSPAETVALDLPDSGSQPLYRVIVALDQQSIKAYGRWEPLRPGMSVDADLLGDTRALFQWLFEPLYSLTSQSTANSYRR